MPSRPVLPILLLIILLTPRLPAQSAPPPLDHAGRTRVVEAAVRLLEERYVFPGIGRTCGERITAQLKSGAYDSLTDHAAFARRLTDDLQAVSADRHMRVRARMPAPGQGADTPPAIRRHREQRQIAQLNNGFDRVEVLEGNIGYVNITGFPPADRAAPTASAAMAIVENTDALIIDLRRNGGGSPSGIRFICSYFFGEKTHLNSLYWREGNRTEEFWTLDSIPGRRRPDLPLFILTSGFTFSGGEEFAYNLKTRKRATLIGETTGGGANPGGFFPLDPPFGMFIPTGRAVNPVTGDNWEGKGVEPDIRADSADALDIALGRARAAVEERRLLAEAAFLRADSALRSALLAAERAEGTGRAPEAQLTVDRALDAARRAEIADEEMINALGYEYLGKKAPAMAVHVLSYNARTYPASANAYDSLGEACRVAGDTGAAIRNYRKSLELNPDNPGARKALSEMGAK